MGATVKATPFPSGLDLWTGQMAKLVLDRAVSIIKARTDDGVDGAGRPFPAYDAQYAAENPGGRDLRRTGLMLDTLTASVSKDGDSGGIRSAAPYANFVNAATEFLALTPAEASDLADWARALVAKRIDQSGR